MSVLRLDLCETMNSPNYTLHPTSGVWLGADFVRTLAHRC